MTMTTVRPKPPEYRNTRGRALLHNWKRTRKLTTVDLTRLLGRSSTFVEALLAGRTRPNAGDMFALRTLARIPLDAWMLVDERRERERRAA